MHLLYVALIVLGGQGVRSGLAQGMPPAQALESLVVSTAERKMQEVRRETDPNVVKAVPGFFGRVAANYPGSPVMYGAMNVAGGKLVGLGPKSQILSPTQHHVTSADSFFQFNISPTWKEKTAARLGVSVGDDKVFDAWCDAVNNGVDIPALMLNPASIGARANAWWSPDARMERPSSTSRSHGDDDFFAMCRIVSLAPEWYPKGLVRLNAATGDCLWIRPVSFDGMTSPLWVQRPPGQPARTGGDAVEVLNKTSIPLSRLGSSQAYIISNDLTRALQGSPSVNEYSPDLARVRPGSTAATQRVARQQIIIVEQVREGRRRANAAFRQYFVEKPLAPPTLPSLPLKSKMPFTRLTDSPEKLSIGQLKDEIRFWVKHDSPEHRGQRFQVERYQRLAAKNKESAAALEAAAIELISQAEEPVVLNLVIHLGNMSGSRFGQTVFDRLMNKDRPLPKHPGIRFASLREEYLRTLASADLKKDKELVSRVDRFFESEGRNDLRLALLSQTPSSQKIPGVIGELLKGNADIHQVGLAAYLLGRHHPGEIMAVAKQATKLPKPLRKEFVAGVEEVASDEWRQSKAKAFRKMLDVD